MAVHDRSPIRLLRLHPKELFSELWSTYWFVPLLLTIGAAVLAFAALLVDATWEISPPAAFFIVFPTSPEGARAMLSAVIGSMITATSVTFSVTIVALTVAAQHFGPRVLNNFVRHTAAQVVLGTFIGTFVYAVLVMGAVRGTSESGDIPQLSVIGATGLVVICVGALIYYIHHISTTLQVGRIAADIAAEFDAAIARVQSCADAAGDTVPEPSSDAAPIPVTTTGYVQRIDYAALVTAAERAGVRVWIRRGAGTFAIAGAPLVLVSPAANVSEALTGAVGAACAVGVDRTTWQDPEFALKQLVEIALRALSPGVNEPFTALTCIDRLAQALATAIASPPPCRVWRGADGTPRVFGDQPAFPVLLRASFDPIRIFAGPNPAVPSRLLDVLGQLARLARTADVHDALRHQAELVRLSATGLGEDDRAFVDERFRVAISNFDPPTA